ncbi:transposase [Paenibacillus sp. NAIST15-1]|nr:transposase [Paenibacillus sp. NAIST15-1]
MTLLTLQSNVKRSQRKAVYLAVDIREDGSKEVLTYTFASTESAFVWNELLQEVETCGTEEVQLFISERLKDIVVAIEQVYPHAKYQFCCVHVARNITHKVHVAD